MSKPIIIPSAGDYFITSYSHGQVITTRIIAFSFEDEDTTAITIGGGSEPCDRTHFANVVTGVVDRHGRVASGCMTFRSVKRFLRHVEDYFDGMEAEQAASANIDPGNPGTVEVEGVPMLH